MHSIAELELDAMRVYEAEISVIAELGLVPADGTETSAALAARVDATQLRQYGQQLAANWELLARFLEYLKPRGWRFKGMSGDGVNAYGIIAKYGKPGELHADLSALPADLRDWLTNEGGLLINRPEPAPVLWHSLRCGLRRLVGNVSTRRQAGVESTRSLELLTSKVRIGEFAQPVCTTPAENNCSLPPVFHSYRVPIAFASKSASGLVQKPPCCS